MKIYSATIPAEVLKMRPREAYYARQKQLFVLAFIVVSIVPLLCINWYSSGHYRRSWLKETSAELAGIAENSMEIITLFLETQEAQLASVAEFNGFEVLGDQQNLERLFPLLQRNGFITDIGVIDQNGNHIAYVGPYANELFRKNYVSSPWFNAALATGRYVSDIFSGYRNVPHVIIAVAAPDKTWVLRATINSELFNSLVGGADVGPGGDAFIINRRGELQTPSRLGRAAFQADQVAFFSEMVERGQGAREAGNSLYAVSTLKEGEWLLVLETNLNSALAEFYKARQFALFIIIAAFGIIVIVSVLLVSSMMDRISRADRQRMTLVDNVRHVEKMALVGRLAASVAHEINNPLQVIADQAGWIGELLEEESPDKVGNLGEYRDSLHKIRSQVKRAGTITHRLLGFSRLKDEEWAPVDINRALDETIVLLENEARNHQIMIRRGFSQDIPQIRTDSAQLQQVFLNILNNAMDSIIQNGEIDVKTKVAENHVLVEFSDNGPGLPEEIITRIFDSFFTTKQKGKGTGLGLSISSNIMQRLGGSISASNREQGGCTFTVSLPAPVREACRRALPELCEKLAVQG